MVRSPGACSSKSAGRGGGGVGVINKGPWTEAEDEILSAHVKAHGEGNWRLIPKLAGLSRCGKSCRLRWINYLRPNLKRGNFSLDEDNLILTLHALLGNRWSLIAGRIPGRTDNEIKNYWNTHLRRKLRSMGIDPMSYKVGLTLTSLPDQEPDSQLNGFVPSSSSSAQTPATTMANSQPVSSPGDSTSTSTSYDSVSATSEPDSSPNGDAIPARKLQLEPWMHLQVPTGVPNIVNSQPLGSNTSAVVNLQSYNTSLPECLHPGLHSGWEYDQIRIEHLQLLDPLEFSGMLQPLESSSRVHNDVQGAPWTTASDSLFDSLLE